MITSGVRSPSASPRSGVEVVTMVRTRLRGEEAGVYPNLFRQARAVGRSRWINLARWSTACWGAANVCGFERGRSHELPVRRSLRATVVRDREIRAFTRDWTARDDRIASLSYFGTFAVYFFTLWLTVQAWPVWWLVVPLIVVNAFAGVRLYVLQHDCGHGSLYSTKRANDLAGHGLSVFTLTPYRVMQFNHNEHHSHLGNLEERDTTEIFTMTLREWEEAGLVDACATGSTATRS
jgi:hypothetical protein